MLLGPLPSLRARHTPILGTYFGYGAIGFTAVAETFWTRSSLAITPAELASVAVWLALPWSIKMVFGQVVDSLLLAGSHRRSWLLLGSALVACGLLLHAANAGGLISSHQTVMAFVLGQMLVTFGIVLQDVVADALTSEIVPRTTAEGTPRPRKQVIEELAMVQVAGRFSMMLGITLAGTVAGLAASALPPYLVFLIGLIVPAFTAAMAIFGDIPEPERLQFDFVMLLGGIGIALVSLFGHQLRTGYGEEIVFVLSLAVVALLFARVAKHLDPDMRRVAIAVAIVVFAFRAEPPVGSAYSWYSIDVLKFDEAFFSDLALISSSMGVVGLWVMSTFISRNDQSRVILWLILAGPVLALPMLANVLGAYTWTEAVIGVGPREIARLDTSLELRVSNLSMIAILTLTAFFAPPGRTATWFALMASIMNLALSGGNLASKYLNAVLPVERGDYSALPVLAIATIAIGTVVPWAVVLSLRRRLMS